MANTPQVSVLPLLLFTELQPNSESLPLQQGRQLQCGSCTGPSGRLATDLESLEPFVHVPTSKRFRYADVTFGHRSLTFPECPLLPV